MAPQHVAVEIHRQELAQTIRIRRMEKVGPLNRSWAATPERKGYFAEHTVLASQLHRDVKSPRLWVIGHRTPAFESGGARAEVYFDADLRDLAGPVCDLAGLRVHIHDR